MDKNKSKLKQEIIYWSKRLYEKGMSPSTSGNISVRYKDNFLVSASGTCLNDLSESEIILIDKEGQPLDKSKNKPTSEKIMHIGIYNQRKDINAIIHCHCPILTSFAVAGIEMNKAILPDFGLLFKKVQLVPYFCPSTKKLATAVKNVFKTDNVALLKNHGVILGAEDLKTAYYRLECLRAHAETYIYSKILGTPKIISKKSIEEIEKIYKK